MYANQVEFNDWSTPCIKIITGKCPLKRGCLLVSSDFETDYTTTVLSKLNSSPLYKAQSK